MSNTTCCIKNCPNVPDVCRLFPILVGTDVCPYVAETEIKRLGIEYGKARDAIIKIYECTECDKTRTILRNYLENTITGKGRKK